MSAADSSIENTPDLGLPPGFSKIRREILEQMDLQADVSGLGRRTVEFDSALRIAEKVPLKRLVENIAASGLLPDSITLTDEYRYKPGFVKNGDFVPDSANARMDFIHSSGIGSVNRVAIHPQMGPLPASVNRDLQLGSSTGSDYYKVVLTRNMYAGETDDVRFKMVMDDKGKVLELTLDYDPVNMNKCIFSFRADGKIDSILSPGDKRESTQEEAMDFLARFSKSYKIDPLEQALDVRAIGGRIANMSLDLSKPIIEDLIPFVGIPKAPLVSPPVSAV